MPNDTSIAPNGGGNDDSLTKYLAGKARVEAHQAWRQRVQADYPGLCTRIFALRSSRYDGYGFHWALERRLGAVMQMTSDYDAILDAQRCLMEELSVEMLYKDVAYIERGLAAAGKR